MLAKHFARLRLNPAQVLPDLVTVSGRPNATVHRFLSKKERMSVIQNVRKIRNDFSEKGIQIRVFRNDILIFKSKLR